MIRADANGNIIVEVNGRVYSLSNTEQYTAFLMWLTSPDETSIVSPDDFSVMPGLPDEYAAKAMRYSEFLEDFARQRTVKLGELSKLLTSEQREAAIEKFITELKGENQ